MSKKQQQEKSLAEKNPQSALTVDNSHLEFKGNEAAEATDILIPRILLMQGTSKWVPDEFNMGDIIDSVEETLLAAKGKTLTIIPFFMKKSWEVFTDEQPPKWLRSDIWDASNDAADWKFEEEDVDRGTMNLFRQRNYGFYCMVLGEDGLDDFAIPALINFRSSSGFKEGKKIASWFGRMKSMDQPGFTVTWEIGSESVKGDDKAYQKFTVKRGRNVTKEEMEPIYKWLKLLGTSAVRVHEETVEESREERTVNEVVENQAQF